MKTLPDKWKKNHPQFQGEIIIDPEKCTACGICVKDCPTRALDIQSGTAYLKIPYFCVQCGHCGAVCPSDAVKATGTQQKKLTAHDIKKTPSSESLQFLFMSRRSVRKYEDKPVAKKDLEKILDAGRYTATGTNCQNVRYVVLTDKKKIAGLRDEIAPLMYRLFKLVGIIAKSPLGKITMGQKLAARMKDIYMPGMEFIKEALQNGDDRIFFNAHALILVYGEKYDDTACFSCSAALYNCSLMAHTMGIGCCFNGFLQTVINSNKKLKRKMGIPGYCKCWGAMTLGYANIKYRRLVTRRPVDAAWL